MLMKKKQKQTMKQGLASEYRYLLRNQQIDELQPGSILHDFDVLLNFVKESAPLKVTQGGRLLPMKALGGLNDQMAHPLKLYLKRPQHKSYPNILGLYLLLRTTGLTLIEGNGTNQYIVIDAEVLQSWSELNLTERYFTLFETALLRADPAVLGERSGGCFDNPLYRWIEFFTRVPEAGLEIARDKKNEDMLKFYPGWYNLTFMQMFGLVTIQDVEPEPGQGWQILKIQATPFGNAMMQVISDLYPNLEDFWEKDFWDEQPEREAKFGELQPHFLPYFPEWQHNLVILEFEPQAGIYIFKVSVWKDVWRRLAVPGELFLDWFSEAILDAFNFDNDHLYRFIYTDRFGIERHIDHPMLHEGIHPAYTGLLTETCAVQDVPLRPGSSMIFFFDFGDCWQFEVFLEEIAPVDPNLSEAKLLEKRGRAPKQYGW